jgi:hypothetical protein
MRCLTLTLSSEVMREVGRAPEGRGVYENTAGGPGQNGVSDDKLTTDECACPAENLQGELHQN